MIVIILYTKTKHPRIYIFQILEFLCSKYLCDLFLQGRSTEVGSEMIRFSFLLSPLFIIGSICFRQRYIIFSILPNDRVLFPSEVGRYLAPLGCLLLDDGVAEVMGVQLSLKRIISLLECYCRLIPKSLMSNTKVL